MIFDTETLPASASASSRSVEKKDEVHGRPAVEQVHSSSGWSAVPVGSRTKFASIPFDGCQGRDHAQGPHSPDDPTHVPQYCLGRGADASSGPGRCSCRGRGWHRPTGSGRRDGPCTTGARLCLAARLLGLEWYELCLGTRNLCGRSLSRRCVGRGPLGPSRWRLGVGWRPMAEMTPRARARNDACR